MNTLLKIIIFLLVIGIAGGLGYRYITEPDRLITALESMPVPENPEDYTSPPALQKLVNMGTLGAAAIVKRFEKASIQGKVAMVVAAGRIRNTTTLPVLQQSLGIKEKNLSTFAAIALARYGKAQAPTLLKWIQSDPNPIVQEYACQALGRIGGPKSIKEIAPELLKLLKHSNTKVQAQALAGLVRMNKELKKADLTPLTEHVGEILPLLESEDEETAYQAALAVADFRIPAEGGLERGKYIKSLLKHPKTYVRRNVLAMMTDLFRNDVGVQDQVALALEDKDETIQKMALDLMFKHGLTIHYPKVLPFLNVEDPELHEKLVDYLGSIHDESLISALEEAFKSTSYLTQYTAIRIAKRIGSVHKKPLYVPLIPYLIECMKVNEPNVDREEKKIRYHAHEALKIITGADKVAYSYNDWMEWYTVSTSIEKKKKDSFQNLEDAKMLIASAADFDPKKKNQMYREASEKLRQAERDLEEIKRFTNYSFEEQLQTIRELKYQANKFLGND